MFRGVQNTRKGNHAFLAGMPGGRAPGSARVCFFSRGVGSTISLLLLKGRSRFQCNRVFGPRGGGGKLCRLATGCPKKKRGVGRETPPRGSRGFFRGRAFTRGGRAPLHPTPQCSSSMIPRAYSTEHADFFFFCCGCMAALIASSNTCFSPSCVRAEHSRYLTAPTSFAMLSALLCSTIC